MVGVTLPNKIEKITKKVNSRGFTVNFNIKKVYKLQYKLVSLFIVTVTRQAVTKIRNSVAERHGIPAEYSTKIWNKRYGTVLNYN